MGDGDSGAGHHSTAGAIYLDRSDQASTGVAHRTRPLLPWLRRLFTNHSAMGYPRFGQKRPGRNPTQRCGGRCNLDLGFRRITKTGTPSHHNQGLNITGYSFSAPGALGWDFTYRRSAIVDRDAWTSTRNTGGSRRHRCAPVVFARSSCKGPCKEVGIRKSTFFRNPSVPINSSPLYSRSRCDCCRNLLGIGSEPAA
jgi:hypothetical protein